MQQKNPAFKRRLLIIIALVLTVQAICLCCVSVAFAGESARPAASAPTSLPTQTFVKSYEDRFNEEVFASTHTRAAWLCALMAATSAEPDRTDLHVLYTQAQQRGIVGDYPEEGMREQLTRDFVCFTLCRAMYYRNRSVGALSDVDDDRPYLATAAYYGYFLPDEEGRVFPDREVTAEEYQALMTELQRIRLLRGKRVVSFGDSIMYGSGNNGAGISGMLADKYGMISLDYSVPGATMGVAKGRRHIPDQVRRALADHVQPDLILLDGGTNDMFLTKCGDLTDGYDMTGTKEDTFTGGFERVMWMLREGWDCPVIYVRAHNMVLGTPENESLFGERGLAIAEKWGAAAVDIYSLSGLDTEDPDMRDRYTYPDPRRDYACDSIHPTAIGYAAFYLPFVTEAVTDHLSKEVSE